MPTQVQTIRPPSRAERLGQREPSQVHVMREPGVPPTRDERLGKKPEAKYRISFIVAVLMICSALFIDVLELITTWEVLGILLSYFTLIFVNLAFWVWFTILGVPVGLSSPKKLLTAGVSNLVGLIPALDAIPVLGWEWTIGVAALILLTYFEDKTDFKLPTSPKKAVTDTIKTT